MKNSTSVNFSGSELLQIIIADEEGNKLLLDLLSNMHNTFEFTKFNENAGIISQILEKHFKSKGTNGSVVKINFTDQEITLEGDELPMKIAESKYRIGNQPEEYLLETKYLGWFPEGENEWFNFLDRLRIPSIDGKEVVIVSPDKKENAVLVLHRRITKDAFSVAFFDEERAKNWWAFCIISQKDNPSEEFIIPLC
jgi:hypothetical protein